MAWYCCPRAAPATLKMMPIYNLGLRVEIFFSGGSVFPKAFPLRRSREVIGAFFSLQCSAAAFYIAQAGAFNLSLGWRERCTKVKRGMWLCPIKFVIVDVMRC